MENKFKFGTIELSVYFVLCAIMGAAIMFCIMAVSPGYYEVNMSYCLDGEKEPCYRAYRDAKNQQEKDAYRYAYQMKTGKFLEVTYKVK